MDGTQMGYVIIPPVCPKCNGSMRLRPAPIIQTGPKTFSQAAPQFVCSFCDCNQTETIPLNLRNIPK
jgi:hypothetical protein